MSNLHKIMQKAIDNFQINSINLISILKQEKIRMSNLHKIMQKAIDNFQINSINLISILKQEKSCLFT